MNDKNDKSISRSHLTGKYLTRNDILKMSAIKSKNNILEEELAHHGILGMKWGVRRYQPYPKGHNQLKEGGRFIGNKPKKGVRRYQNKDGSLTSAGRDKYRAKSSDSNVTKKVKKDLSTLTGEEFKRKYQVSNTKYMKRVDKYVDPYMNSPLAKFGKKLEAEAKKNAERWTNKALKKAEKANKLAADQKKGTSAANALISAQKKAKETGIVDSNFLNNPNISQKAKNKVISLAKQSKKRAEKARIKRGKAKAKSITEIFGDQYPVIVDEKGIVYMKIGDDLWKVGH